MRWRISGTIVVCILSCFSLTVAGADGGVRLTGFQATASSCGLEVHYEVLNGLEQPILLPNVLYRVRDGEVVVSRHFAYTSIDADTLVIEKMIPEVPSGWVVEALEVPFITLVEAGARLSETLCLPLPLEARGAYDGLAMAEEMETGRVTDVRLVLGWLPDAPYSAITVADREVLALSDPRASQALQRFLSSKPRRIEATASWRKDRNVQELLRELEKGRSSGGEPDGEIAEEE